MPRLAIFPKAFMDALCVDGSMTIRQWIELAATLKPDGLEFYAGFLELKNPSSWSESRQIAESLGLAIPMLCCSPDFTHPDPLFRRRQVDQEKRWIDLAAALGAQFCRVLSGQRRPGIVREDGIRWTVDCIRECLTHAAGHRITLVIENHYKDNYWEYPEFAQKMDVFCDLIAQVKDANFGVNFDPSNTLVAGEDPLELLKRIVGRVVTMHASDRHFDNQQLRHGEIGKGLNDYDAIFSLLADAGFDGWVSIEDGVDGVEQLRRSVEFLREKLTAHWPGNGSQ